MPIFNRDEKIVRGGKVTDLPKFGSREALELKPETTTDYDLANVVGAAFSTENTLGSIVSDESQRMEVDPEYDPFNNIGGYEGHAERFYNANTNEDVQSIKNQIDKEAKNKQLIEEAGGLGVVANLAAGVLDPINLIPVGGSAYKAYSLGGSILKGALTTARAGVVGATVAETALHATQETRTLGESATNVAGAAILSGVLGAAAGALGRDGLAIMGKRLEDEMVIPKPDEPDVYEPNSLIVNDSVGAKRVRDTNLAQETLSNAFGFEKAAEIVGLNPKIRLATSPSVETRRFTQEVIESDFYYEKNAEGIANPIAMETIVKLQEAKVAKVVKNQKDAFKQYRNRVKKETGTKVKYEQFREDIGKALRRNDTSDIPEIQEAARFYRKELFDPMKQAAIDAKLLDKDVVTKTADSYLYRLWDKQKVRAKRNELKPIIFDGLRGLPEINTKDGIVLSDDELLDIADDIIDRLAGGSHTRLPYDLPVAVRGPLKERTLSFIRDVDVEDFLVNDIEVVAQKFTRTIAPDIAFKDWFDQVDVMGEDGIIRNAIVNDYKQLIDNAKTEKQRTALQDRRDNDLRDMEAMINQVRGTYGIPENPDSLVVRIPRGIRGLQYISKLGGMTPSAFSDLARPIMVNGMMNVYGDAIKPFVKNMTAIKMVGQELKDMGIGVDMVLDSRAMTLAEVNNPYIKGTKFEKGLDAAVNGFGKVTLMTQWNDALKQIAGVVTQARVIREANNLAVGKASKKNVRYLAKVGIDAQMAERISKQLAKHGEDYDGVKLARAERWQDRQAATAYMAAIRKEVDRTIVTPGAGDIPLLLKGTEAGKMIGQFKSFSFASTNKTLISGLQEADAQTLVGWNVAIGLGMMSYAFKTWDRGEELSDDPRVWLSEGVDRSGVLASLSEVNQISSKFTRGVVSINGLMGLPQLSRYASSNAIGVLAGPTVGTVKDLATATGAAATGEWTKSDSRAFRRMWPYQNLSVARQVFDEAEEGINNTLGVK